MTQARLWYETPEEAFQSLVDALGGFKKVACEMWPTMPANEAMRRLSDCLNPARAHKLELQEVLWLLRKGRNSDCHVAMAYLNEHCGYAKPEPVNPETEVQRLQREFVMAVQQLTKIQTDLASRQSDVQAMRRAA